MNQSEAGRNGTPATLPGSGESFPDFEADAARGSGPRFISRGTTV